MTTSRSRSRANPSKLRTGESPRAAVERAISGFTSDWQRRFEIIEVTADLADRAMLLARRYPLRGYDAIHLAARLTADDICEQHVGGRATFISADRNLSHAAGSDGLLIDAPNSHP